MSLSRKLARLILSGKVTLATVTEHLAKYKMLSLLPSVRQAIIQMSRVTAKDTTIMIETPFPLSDTSIIKIRSIVGDMNAEYEVNINKNVLAGFTARFKGILYDGSSTRIIKQLSTK